MLYCCFKCILMQPLYFENAALPLCTLTYTRAESNWVHVFLCALTYAPNLTALLVSQCYSLALCALEPLSVCRNRRNKINANVSDVTSRCPIDELSFVHLSDCLCACMCVCPRWAHLYFWLINVRRFLIGKLLMYAKKFLLMIRPLHALHFT